MGSVTRVVGEKGEAPLVSIRQRKGVCQLTSGHAVDDERILHRMARTPAQYGYRSTLVGPQDGSLSFEGVTMIACPRTGSRVGGWRRWTAWLPILWWALGSKEKLFHVHDPDLIVAALILILFGRHVIYDVHDDYEASFKDRLRGRGWLACWFPSLWWWFERNAARLFDGIVVADRHLANKFARCHPVILGNYPRLDFTPPAATEDEETFNLLYVGGVTRERGLGMALEALKRLPMPELRLHVVGTGRDQALLDGLRGETRVVLHGQVPWTELHRYYQRAHVGLALYQPLAGYLYCPGENAVKILEYMAAGIPVLCSNFPGLKIFVEDAGCGLVVQPEDPEAIALQIKVLYDNPDLRRKLGARGRSLFETEYNWEKHEKKLIELYDKVLAA